MPAASPQSSNRIERVLAIMAITVVGLCVVAFVVVIIAGAAGVGADVLNSYGFQLLKVVPLVGLPIAFLLILATTIVAVVRRRRDAD